MKKTTLRMRNRKGTGKGMEIIFSEERMPGQTIVELMQKSGELCVKEEGLKPERITVSVTFVSNDEIRELNSIYRNINKITDVLSFPQYENKSEFPLEGEICLGDIVICTEQALLQADEYGHSAERELVYLFVHGILHLLGYDHMEETETDKMRTMEEKIMSQIGLER